MRTSADAGQRTFSPKPPSVTNPGAPKGVDGQMPTLSPTCQSLTPSPTSATAPATSWPMTMGR